MRAGKDMKLRKIIYWIVLIVVFITLIPTGLCVGVLSVIERAMRGTIDFYKKVIEHFNREFYEDETNT